MGEYIKNENPRDKRNSQINVAKLFLHLSSQLGVPSANHI